MYNYKYNGKVIVTQAYPPTGNANKKWTNEGESRIKD